MILQYRALFWQPERKLKDSFSVLRFHGIICDILFVICAILGIRNGLNGILTSPIPLLFLVFVLASIYPYMNMPVRKLRSERLTFDTGYGTGSPVCADSAASK